MVISDSATFAGQVPTHADEYILPWSGRGVNYTEDEIAAVVEVMKHGDPLTQGKYLSEFEAVFSQYHGGHPSFATSSGASALELAAAVTQIEPGDEVVLPAHTYVASALPFARRGAKLIWADIDPDLRVVTEETIARCVTPKTRVVVVVHLYGLNAPMDGIMNLSEKYDFLVVEDCAQSLGASYRGKKSGTYGQIACYSFHAQKNITTLGEGGMIMVKSQEHAKLIPGLRHNGHRPYPQNRECYWLPAMINVDFDLENVWPYNFSIGEAQCALGVSMMSRLDELNQRRYRNARYVIESLSDCPELKFQEIPYGSTHVYHLLCAKYDGERAGANRNDLIQILASKYRIQAAVQYYPLYRYPMFVKSGMAEANCPNTDEFFDNMMSLPFYEWYSEEQLDYLISSVRAAIDSLRRGKRW